MGTNHNSDLNHNSNPKEEETVNSNNHPGNIVRDASNRGREDHSAGNRSSLRAVGSNNPGADSSSSHAGSGPTTAPLPRLPPTAAATAFSPAPAAPTRPHASRRPARS